MPKNQNNLQSLALRCAAVFAAGILAVASRAAAEVPQQINHQGVVSVDGLRFDGTGAFRFAIVDPGDPDPSEVLWSNDGSITGAVGGIPTAAVSLTVTDGVYSVGLGDTNLANMTDQIPSSVFNDDNARLRIWFDDGVNGIQQLTPDHRLTTAPYANRTAVADTAEGLNIPGTSTPAVTVGGTGDVSISGDLTVLGGPDSSTVITVLGGEPRMLGTASIAIHVDSDNDTSGSVLFQKGALESPEFLFGVDNNGVVSGPMGTYHVPSDIRLKRNVSTIPNGLARILSMRGVNFKWKDSGIDGDALQMGVIAQEVEKVFPEAVHTAEDRMKTKSVEHYQLVGALIEAIKELDGIVKQKDAELEAQARRIGTVESRLAALEGRLLRVAQTDRRD